MVKCYMSLGSNVGDRLMYLQEACRMLVASGKVFNLECSSLYETEPIGYVMQEQFYNICIRFDTELLPIELLNLSQKIENDLFRVREILNGPRTIDLDILLYGRQSIKDDRLTIPHPRMFERAFVLTPLFELRGIKDLIAVPDKQGVTKLQEFTY